MSEHHSSLSSNQTPESAGDTRPAHQAQVAKHVSVVTGYAHWAQDYDQFANPMTFLVARALPGLLSISAQQAGPLLELGCGTGRNLEQLFQAGLNEAIGVDLSSEMLAVAEKKLAARAARLFRHDLAQPLPLADASVQTVLISLVLEHIEAFQALMAEVARVLRPGGSLLIFEIHPFQRLSGRRAHYQDEDGQDCLLPSFPHLIRDYFHAAQAVGLQLVQLEEYASDAALTKQFPKLARYADQPILLGMRYSR